MAGMKGVNKQELGSTQLAEKLDWKGLNLGVDFALGQTKSSKASFFRKQQSHQCQKFVSVNNPLSL
jgi:hypothetical protein